ncbi:hypothetical protein G5714_011406 [Onychostoma macrolepis]|uniref:BHLH domain-containing protein n=1 Tax=Onychostoma macrolepis TaxID=369639 RepID=A0A7J6CMN2_9TELE|nr:hypothetical protein G5714_011406 [Onychostoma macrolepis]
MEELKQTMRDVGRHMLNDPPSGTQRSRRRLQESVTAVSLKISERAAVCFIEHVAAHIPHCLSELFHWLQTVRNSNKLKPHTFIWRSGSINRGAAASANQTHSEQRDLQHRDPDMTPTIISKEHLPLNNKKAKGGEDSQILCQLKLKCLLAPEFFKQQPDSKLEKADILEMTLNFLQRHNPSSHAVSQGFSRCVHEILHFLSKDEMNTESQRKCPARPEHLQQRDEC